jgi:hypothetical protein
MLADISAILGSLDIVFQVLANQIEQIETAVAALERQLLAWHKSNPVSQRLASIPGIGPIIYCNCHDGCRPEGVPLGPRVRRLAGLGAAAIGGRAYRFVNRLVYSTTAISSISTIASG